MTLFVTWILVPVLILFSALIIIYFGVLLFYVVCTFVAIIIQRNKGPIWLNYEVKWVEVAVKHGKWGIRSAGLKRTINNGQTGGIAGFQKTCFPRVWNHCRILMKYQIYGIGARTVNLGLRIPNMPESSPNNDNDPFFCIQCFFSSVCFMYRLPDRAKIATEIDLICNMKPGYRRIYSNNYV